MSTRIRFSAAGRHPGRIPAYAILTDADDSTEAAVCRAIERTTRSDVVACSSDGHSEGASHWQLQLGRPVGRAGSGQGHYGVGQLHVTIYAGA